jgi:hypothetical protein
LLTVPFTMQPESGAQGMLAILKGNQNKHPTSSSGTATWSPELKTKMKVTATLGFAQDSISDSRKTAEPKRGDQMHTNNETEDE